MITLSGQICAPRAQVVLLLLLCWLAHEAGHLLALKFLGFGGRLKMGGGLGAAVELSPGAQGWRGAIAAAGGPLINFLLMQAALALGWQTAAQVNFVLAAVNLLPLLPLDGGRIILGLFSGLISWRRLAALLLFWARAAAIALGICVYYFGLTRLLLPAALWLYLLAAKEEGRLAYLHITALWACRGRALRPLRRIYLRRDKPLYKVVALLSPGWRNLVSYRGRPLEEDELLELWQQGRGADMISAVISK